MIDEKNISGKDEVMDIRQLRIGNYLFYKGELVHVTFLSLDIDDEYRDLLGFCKYKEDSNEIMDWVRALYPDIQPISITEDVLLKCGFVNGRIKLCHNRFLQWNYGYDFCIENGIEDYLYEIENVKNLHQLQNLYFSLTNQELIYSP